MNYTLIPGTPLRPSAICLGTDRFGSAISQEDAFRLLDAFADAGGNFIDTANIYAAWLPNGVGASERTLGAWFKRSGARASWIVATKGGHPRMDTQHVSRLAPADLAHDLQQSLERLGMQSVDLYWLHRDDPRIPVGEIVEPLNEHIAAGRIRAIGASNWTPARIALANAYAQAKGLAGFRASQIAWSLAAPNVAHITPGLLYMDAPTREFHARTGLPVAAYSPQAQGFFSGKYDRNDATPADSFVARLYFNSENFVRLERARTLAARHGRTPNEVALAYIFRGKFPVYAIAGSRTVEQLAASCRALDLQLSPQEAAWLDGSGSDPQ